MKRKEMFEKGQEGCKGLRGCRKGGKGGGKVKRVETLYR